MASGNPINIQDLLRRSREAAAQKPYIPPSIAGRYEAASKISDGQEESPMRKALLEAIRKRTPIPQVDTSTPVPGLAEGGTVEPEKPSLFSRLGDFLFGRKALQQAAQTTPPPTPQQPQQDISYIKKAAQEAAERMRKAKETGAKEFKHGGMIKPGSYGKRL